MTDVTGKVVHRRWRGLALVLAAIMSCGVLAACTDNTPGAEAGSNGEVAPRTVEPGEAESDQEIEQLNIGVFGTVPTLNPLDNIASGLYTNSLGLESLLRVDMNGELQPWLASDWEQVSDTVYEYTLREGVKFWDGTELKSSDVKFAWEKRMEKGTPFFVPIETVETPDDYTVRVTLTEPDSSWQYTPALFYSNVYQQEFFEENEETFGQPETLVMGTGPWKFDSLNPTTGMEMSAHSEYWGGEPPIKKISAKFFNDDNSMALALRAGEIDFTPFVNRPNGFDSAAGGDTLTTVSTCASALFSMPTQTEPWDDLNVRKAVAHAINRDDLIAATQGRAGDPLEYLIAPSLMEPLGSEEEVESALDTVPTYEYDLEKAQAAMAESSVPDGFEHKIITTTTYAPTVEVIAAQLKEIGIDLTIDSVSDTDFSTQITAEPQSERPLTFSETGACAPDPSWDELFLGENVLNIAAWQPDGVAELLTGGRAEQEPAKRLEIYTELLQRLGEDVPYVPIYEEGATQASQEYKTVDFGSYWMNGPWALNLVPK